MNAGDLQPRRFAGYAAIFDHPDRGGDIVRKGAFGRAAKAGLPLLWQHDRARRIGFIERLEEDDRGLRVVATMDADAPPVADGAGLSRRPLTHSSPTPPLHTTTKQQRRPPRPPAAATP